MTAKKQSTTVAWVDPDDAPELTEEFFDRADLYEGSTLVRRGVGRPAGSTKTATTLRLDDEVLDAFKASGKGWQTRINDVLKEYLRTHTPGR
jgi:uncharacterized protein (DUF4415 family)